MTRRRANSAPPRWVAFASILLGLSIIGLASCARHDDGMGDVWRGVRHCERMGCG